MTEKVPFSAACERNKDPILQVISPHLRRAKTVLEIGSGSAQHAVHFAQAFTQLTWQTSDQAPGMAGIIAQCQHAKLSNLLMPVELDVNQKPWFEATTVFDLVYSANTMHIMTSADIHAFFSGLPSILSEGGVLILYGPFKFNQAFTSDSNADFDKQLRARGVGSAIRDFEWIDALAQQRGFRLIEHHKMPAHNECFIWKINTALPTHAPH